MDDKSMQHSLHTLLEEKKMNDVQTLCMCTYGTEKKKEETFQLLFIFLLLLRLCVFIKQISHFTVL